MFEHSMSNRIAMASGLVLAVVVVGACSSKPPTPLSSTASVTVNGTDAKIQVVKCNQLEWYRTIDIGGAYSGVQVSIDEHADPLVVRSVRIQNLGGFTGLYT